MPYRSASSVVREYTTASTPSSTSFREAADAVALSPFDFSVQVFDRDWLAGRREIDAFFVQEVDRDKLVLFGSR